MTPRVSARRAMLLPIVAVTACGSVMADAGTDPSGGMSTSEAAARRDEQASRRADNPRVRLGHADVILEPEGHPAVHVAVEVAHTDALRRRGLSRRRHLAPNTGMLFVFARPSRQSFWMRDTFLPLDILFIGEDRRVVGIVPRARPLSDDEQAVEAESQYVLEVHAGFAEEHSLTTGTPVRFTNVSEE